WRDGWRAVRRRWRRGRDSPRVVRRHRASSRRAEGRAGKADRTSPRTWKRAVIILAHKTAAANPTCKSARKPSAVIAHEPHCRPAKEISSAMTSALIIRPSSLGDIVHALPIVHDLHQHRPGLAIDWVVEEPFTTLVRLNRGVRRVIAVALRRWRHRVLSRSTWRELGAFRHELVRERYD